MPRASSRPALKTRRDIDTNEEQVGQPGIVTMPVTGKAELEKPDIQIVDGPTGMKKAEILAFMDEVVMVEVAAPNDKFEPQFVQLWNDGRIQVIPCGIPTPVKRKYIEVLSRMKKNTYRNEEYRDPDGNESVRWPKTTHLRHPFQVVEDKNPNGKPWLRKILMEAA